MDPFFQDLGGMVLARWKRENFSLAKFPEIARGVLEERPPVSHVDLPAFLRGFLLQEEQPFQTQSGFGQPELVVYAHPRFYVQVLFWLDGMTDIHQHEFSGAFHVLAGSSIHARFEFVHPQAVTPYLRVGDVRMQSIELLQTGQTVPILSGTGYIHSLFHLDTPSITVVVRTQHDPGTAPQFNYLPPHIALDPTFNDALTTRRRQLLEVLEQIGDPTYPDIVREMIAELDFERGFFVLDTSRSHLHDLGEWDAVLTAFQEKHGRLAAGVAASLAEAERRESIATLRSSVVEPEHRFFLALLLNVPHQSHLLALVAQRFPDHPPAETIVRWAAELLEPSEFGTTLLDACFPVRPRVVVAALGHFLEGGKQPPAALDRLTTGDVEQLRAILAASSLRPLLGDAP
jgi:hypothetical protein